MVGSGYGKAKGRPHPYSKSHYLGYISSAFLLCYRSRHFLKKQAESKPMLHEAQLREYSRSAWRSCVPSGPEAAPPRPLFSGGVLTGICLPEGHVKIIMESLKHFNLFMGTNDFSKSKELYLKYTLTSPTVELQQSARESCLGFRHI